MSLDYWLIIIVSVSLGYTYYSRVSKGIVKIDHFGYIMIGIIFYWLLPIYAYEKNIEVHAGHGLTYKSTSILSKIEEISEFNIGHFIISESLFNKMSSTIRKFKRIINN